MMGFMSAQARRPTVADQHWAKVVSLLHFEGPPGSSNYRDETGRLWYGSAPLGTSWAKYGNTSLQLDWPQYIATASSEALCIGGQDFTIEVSVKAASTSGHHVIACKDRIVQDYREWILLVDNDFGYRIGFGMMTNVGNFSLHSEQPIIVGREYFIQVVRSNGVVKLAIDGVVESSVAVGEAIVPSTSAELTIGGTSGPNVLGFLGSIDEFRMTCGIGRDVTAAPTGPFLPH